MFFNPEKFEPKGYPALPHTWRSLQDVQRTGHHERESTNTWAETRDIEEWREGTATIDGEVESNGERSDCQGCHS